MTFERTTHTRLYRPCIPFQIFLVLVFSVFCSVFDVVCVNAIFWTFYIYIQTDIQSASIQSDRTINTEVIFIFLNCTALAKIYIVCM